MRPVFNLNFITVHTRSIMQGILGSMMQTRRIHGASASRTPVVVVQVGIVTDVKKCYTSTLTLLLRLSWFIIIYVCPLACQCEGCQEFKPLLLKPVFPCPAKDGQFTCWPHCGWLWNKLFATFFSKIGLKMLYHIFCPPRVHTTVGIRRRETAIEWFAQKILLVRTLHIWKCQSHCWAVPT